MLNQGRQAGKIIISQISIYFSFIFTALSLVLPCSEEHFTAAGIQNSLKPFPIQMRNAKKQKNWLTFKAEQTAILVHLANNKAEKSLRMQAKSSSLSRAEKKTKFSFRPARNRN